MIYRFLAYLTKSYFDTGEQQNSEEQQNFLPVHPHQEIIPHGSTDGFSVDWVLPGRLAIGPLPDASAIEILRASGFQAVLALCSEAEGAWPLEVKQRFDCQRISLPDSRMMQPLTSDQIAIAVNHIDQCIQQNQPIFVHCLAGIERSPTICIAYLCRHYHCALWESLSWVKQIHPESRPSNAQLQAIRHYLDKYNQKIALSDVQSLTPWLDL